VIADRGSALSVSMHQGEPPRSTWASWDSIKSSFNPTMSSPPESVERQRRDHRLPHAVKGATTQFEPHAATSTDAEPLPAERFAMLFDPATLLDGFKPTGQRLHLAARVTGNVQDDVPGGPPTGRDARPGHARSEGIGQAPATRRVRRCRHAVGLSCGCRQQNFFGQRIAQAWANNGDLVLNSLDNLSGSADLISVRGRATFTRPFERVEALRRIADERFRAKEQELEQQLRATEEKLETLHPSATTSRRSS
jgi:ABC-type uncharacterized transport system involved in gliding motility auxiliary subunit